MELGNNQEKRLGELGRLRNYIYVVINTRSLKKNIIINGIEKQYSEKRGQ